MAPLASDLIWIHSTIQFSEHFIPCPRKNFTSTTLWGVIACYVSSWLVVYFLLRQGWNFHGDVKQNGVCVLTIISEIQSVIARYICLALSHHKPWDSIWRLHSTSRLLTVVDIYWQLMRTSRWCGSLWFASFRCRLKHVSRTAETIHLHVVGWCRRWHRENRKAPSIQWSLSSMQMERWCLACFGEIKRLNNSSIVFIVNCPTPPQILRGLPVFFSKFLLIHDSILANWEHMAFGCCRWHIHTG